MPIYRLRRRLTRKYGRRYRSRRYGYKRRRTALSFKRTGLPRNVGRSRRALLYEDTATMSASTRVLNSHDITYIPKSTADTTDRQSYRDTNSVLVAGFKIQGYIRNNSEVPMCFNWAIVSMKPTVAESMPAADAVDPLTAVNFFRGYESQRGVNLGTTQTSVSNFLSSINTDIYNVHVHKRAILNPGLKIWAPINPAMNPDGTPTIPGAIVTWNLRYNEHKREFKWINRYVKMKRVVAWDENSSLAYSGRVFFCMWADTLDSAKLQGPIINTWEHQIRIITYFKDNK